MADSEPQPAGWAIVIHGGAGVIERAAMSAQREAGMRGGLASALASGAAVLRAGGAALDAVEAAVRALEEDVRFNAGRGAVFSADGTNALDASIMDGRTLGAGAVAGVMRTRSPIGLARAVMAHSDHVLLAGEGADAFAASHGLEQVAPGWFRTDERWRQYEEFKASGSFDKAVKYGTVGAVARDAQGALAAATSTGGLTGKRWGRVGDSPIVGAGTYADEGCAVSATGSGEAFIRLAVAHEICARVRLTGMTPLDAARAVVGTELGRIGGSGGVIVIGRDGPGPGGGRGGGRGRGGGGWAFNSPGMYRARESAGTPPEIAIYGDEDAHVPGRAV